MAKARTMFVCGECDRAFFDRTEADRCEAWDREAVELERCRAAWRALDDLSYPLKLDDIAKVRALVEDLAKARQG